MNSSSQSLVDHQNHEDSFWEIQIPDSFTLEILIWEVWGSDLWICISKTFDKSQICESPQMTA